MYFGEERNEEGDSIIFNIEVINSSISSFHAFIRFRD